MIKPTIGPTEAQPTGFSVYEILDCFVDIVFELKHPFEDSIFCALGEISNTAKPKKMYDHLFNLFQEAAPKGCYFGRQDKKDVESPYGFWPYRRREDDK